MKCMRKKVKKNFVVIRGLVGSILFGVVGGIQPNVIKATNLSPTHIGTFSDSTTFRLKSESGVLPILELEVETKHGKIERYETEIGELLLPETKEGTTVKRAILKGKTLVNLLDMRKCEVSNNLNTQTLTIKKGVTYTLKGVIEAAIRHSSSSSYGFRIKETDAQGKDLYLKELFNNEDHFEINSSFMNETSEQIQIRSYNQDKNKIKVMIIEGDYTEFDIPYFQETNSVQSPMVTIANEDGTKVNHLTLAETVVLRSNGEVYDELDLLTGKLIQRIGSDGQVLDQEIIKIIELKSTYHFPPYIQVVGQIAPIITSLTIPSEPLTFALNPNQEAGQQFIAPEFEVTNESNAPLNLTLKTFEQTTDVLNDVLPTQYESWDDLTKEQSKDFALGLVSKPSNDWLDCVEEPHYVSETDNKLLGTIKPKGTVGFEFTAHHGQAFDEILNPSYHLTFVFDLLN